MLTTCVYLWVAVTDGSYSCLQLRLSMRLPANASLVGVICKKNNPKPSEVVLSQN